ncbi:hypothetical protein V5799_005394 [Amblyomma americanum]|uniref:Beta-1,4-glucuronyltransferase 1 n=1 Tax=Amblyomma americanum TaxID=6943 RepID=A0AAQ4DZD5_AMBAM
MTGCLAEGMLTQIAAAASTSSEFPDPAPTSLYRIYHNAIVGNKRSPSSKAAVCLSTIASLDHLHWLRELSDHWTGPVSVAVFFREDFDLQLVVTYVHVLRVCFAAIRDNFSFHFVSPLDRNNSGAKDAFAWEDSDEPLFCDSHRALLRALLTMQRRRGWPRMPFPQNHLRNVARDGCVSSPYFYATDVDVMPQYGLYERLSAFLAREPPCAKCLYVVPAFEGTEFAVHPRTKSALLSRTGQKKEFRVYHAVAFGKNQRATNFSKWKKVPSKDEMFAAYEAVFEFGYECFYVGPHDVPKFREIFIGYGFTRNVQALEAHLAGFRFLVLSDAFTIHRGMRNTTVNESFRNAEKSRNYRIFLGFRKTLEHRYGKGRTVAEGFFRHRAHESTPTVSPFFQAGRPKMSAPKATILLQ